MTDFTIILRSLRARLFSTVTTLLTVAVAVGLMLTLLSMRDAGRQAFERGSGNMHLLVSGDSSPLTAVLNSIFYANAPARPIPWARAEAIAADPRVEFTVPIQQGDSFAGFPVVGAGPTMFSRFEPAESTKWAFAPGRTFEKNFEAVLGSEVARATGLKVGDRIALTHGTSAAREAHVHEEFKYTVVGVLRPTGSPHDRAVFTNLESAWIIHANEKHEREHAAEEKAHEGDKSHDDDDEHVELTDADRLVTGIYIRLATRPGMTASAILPQFASELRRDTGLTVAAPTDEIRRLFAIVSNVDRIFVGIALVVMVSSGIAIMLALYNSMSDRRRQIAVLRVLGCSKGRIFGLIVTEAAIIGLLGAVAGLLLAVGGSKAVSLALQDRLGLVVRPLFTPEWVLVVGVGTVVLGAAAGLIPAVLAYRTSVAKNLKPIG